MSALRLTEKGYRVAVFEAGERKRPADLPTSNWDLRRYLWFPRLGMRGIQRRGHWRDEIAHPFGI